MSRGASSSLFEGHPGLHTPGPSASLRVVRGGSDYTSIGNVVYASHVKRLQIMIDEDLDEALERQARLESTSKAALIRRFVRLHLAALPPLDDDPLGEMIGRDAFEPDSVDDVVYR